MNKTTLENKGYPAKSADFVGRGGATERADFGTNCPEVAERSLCRRVPKAPDGRVLEPSGLFLMDGIEGLRSLPRHSVDMLLTDPPYGTTRNYWDVPLPLIEFWEAVRWAVKPDGAVLLFSQCPYDKVLGASNLAMLRYEWIWYKERGTGFLNANRAPLKKSENILVFYQKPPVYNPQFTYGEPYRKTHARSGSSPNYGKFERVGTESSDGRRYDPENIRAVIAGKRPVPHIHDAAAPTPRRVNLIVDIQERLRSGKGPAYERWAKVYNLKQMAAALMFLQEHQLTEYDQLAAQADGTAQRFHALAGELRQTEADLAKTSALMEAVVQYAKSRPVFEGYKAARYSKKYLAEHGPELADYRAAKAALNELLDGEKLPKMDALKEKRRKLAARKKALYAEYRAAQQEMREAVAVKANIDHLLGLSDERKNKEQER